MPFYTVRRGDCMSSIAKEHGFANWRTIWDHVQNEELRRKRTNVNLLAVGDVVFIPERQVRQEPAATQQQHVFTRAVQRTKLRIVLKDLEQKPYANKRYRLAIGSNGVEGVTGANGLIEQPIPDDAREAELTVFFDEQTQGVWKLKLGALDPVEETTGVRSRLSNLGRPCETDAMEEALRGFQTAESLNVSGRVDDATKGRLVERHDRLG